MSQIITAQPGQKAIVITEVSIGGSITIKVDPVTVLAFELEYQPGRGHYAMPRSYFNIELENLFFVTDGPMRFVSYRVEKGDAQDVVNTPEACRQIMEHLQEGILGFSSMGRSVIVVVNGVVMDMPNIDPARSNAGVFRSALFNPMPK